LFNIVIKKELSASKIPVMNKGSNEFLELKDLEVEYVLIPSPLRGFSLLWDKPGRASGTILKSLMGDIG
jgi:hypothetical protein